MAVAQPSKSAKAHDGVSYAPRHLVDNEVINLTDILSLGQAVLSREPVNLPESRRFPDCSASKVFIA